MIKFSVTHNTTSDIFKAVFAGLTAGLAALIPLAGDGFTAVEWLSAGLATALAAGSALGFYSSDAYVAEEPDGQ